MYVRIANLDATPSSVESYLSTFNVSLYYKSLDWLKHVGSKEDTHNSGRSAAQDVPTLSISILPS